MILLSYEYVLYLFILLIHVKRGLSLEDDDSNNPTIDFTPSKRYLIKVNVDIGNPPQNVTLLVDTLSIYLWVYNSTATSKGFNASNSLTYEPNNKFNLSEYSMRYDIHGSCGYDTIRIDNKTLFNNFSFCVINNSTGITEIIEDNEDDVVGILGIGHCLEEDKDDIKPFFLLEQLKDKSLVDKLSLSIKFQNEYKGKLRFGDEITHLSDVYSAQTSLDIKQDRIWAFTSPIMGYGSSNSSNSSITVLDKGIRMLIDTSTEYVVVNMTVFDLIVDAFFAEDINTTSCNRTTMIKDGNAYDVVKCNDDVHFNSIPNLYIYITQIDALQITPLDLLRHEVNITDNNVLPIYTFLIIGNENVQEFSIGQSVLRKFSITLDKSNGIRFSSIDSIVHQNHSLLRIIKDLCVVGTGVVLLCVGGYLLAVCVFKNNKSIKKNKYNRSDKKRPTTLSNFTQSIGSGSLLPKSVIGEKEEKDYNDNDEDDDLKLTITGKNELN
jgi:hypothetical protein